MFVWLCVWICVTDPPQVSIFRWQRGTEVILHPSVSSHLVLDTEQSALAWTQRRTCTAQLLATSFLSFHKEWAFSLSSLQVKPGPQGNRAPSLRSHLPSDTLIIQSGPPPIPIHHYTMMKRPSAGYFVCCVVTGGSGEGVGRVFRVGDRCPCCL